MVNMLLQVKIMILCVKNMAILNFNLFAELRQPSTKDGSLMIELLLCVLLSCSFVLVVARYQALIINWQAHASKGLEILNALHSIAEQVSYDQSILAKNMHFGRVCIDWQEHPLPIGAHASNTQRFAIIELIGWIDDKSQAYRLATGIVRA